MSAHSPLLDKFDPFATHPFTNNSGLQMPPPAPSLYPHPSPSPRYELSSPFDSLSQKGAYAAPKKMSPSPLPSPSKGVFVPFRKDTASPDIVLKKKPEPSKKS